MCNVVDRPRNKVDPVLGYKQSSSYHPYQPLFFSLFLKVNTTKLLIPKNTEVIPNSENSVAALPLTVPKL